MRSLDIICPVFREQEVIGLFHQRLAGGLDGLRGQLSIGIIYVLDPSPDRTEEILAEIAIADPRVTVLVLSRRFGHQAALLAGMHHSRADAVVMLDSDLQHPPELIPELVRHWQDGAEIVQTLRRDSSETAFLKRTTSRWFYSTLAKIGSVQLRSGAADYRLLSRRVVNLFCERIRERNPFLRGLVEWVGFRIVYVPFQSARREGGRSKYRPSTLINFALNGIISFSKAPLRLCILAGFAMAALSFLLGVVDILVYLLGTVTVPGWASLLAVVTFIGGIQLFFLGVIGEYIGLIFDEVKNRPLYLIGRTYGTESPADTADGGTKS